MFRLQSGEELEVTKCSACDMKSGKLAIGYNGQPSFTFISAASESYERQLDAFNIIANSSLYQPSEVYIAYIFIVAAM